MRPAEPTPSAQTLAGWADASSELLALSSDGGSLLWCNAAFAARFGARLPAPLALTPPASPDETLAIDDGIYVVRARRVSEGIAWQITDVTAQHQAERRQELLETAQLFGRLGVWERDVATGRGQWDRHIFAFWGLDPDMPTPDYAQALRSVHPEDRHLLPPMDGVFTPGRYSQRFRVIQPDGSVRWIHSHWEIKPGPDGRPRRAVGVMMDDTEVYELARSLGDASAQLKLAVELADLAVWRHDLANDRMFYNDRAFSVLGITPLPAGLPLEEVRALIHPDDMPGVLASARRALETDRPTDMQARYRRSDGSWRHVLTRRVVQRASDGTPLAFLGVALDLTEQVERQQQASELAMRLENASGAAGVGVWTRDPSNETGDWNREMFSLNGWPPERGVPTQAQWIAEIVHPDDRQRMSRVREDLMRSPRGAAEHEYRIVLPDGSVRWLVNRARVTPWNGQSLIFGVTLDVTERRRAEQALRSADQRAALAARSAGIGTWEADFETGTERWDEQMFRLRGLDPRGDTPGREERLALLHPDDRGQTADTSSESLRSDQALRYEFRVVWPDGSVRWLASRSMAVIDERGRATRRIGVNWDITDVKEAEATRAAAAVAERASHAKSQFLARMSHELRTPLNAVLGFTQLLQFEDKDPSRAVKLGHIRSAGEHLLSLIEGVLDLSGMETGSLKLQPRPLNLAALVAQALPLVADMAQRHGVRIVEESVRGSALADRTRTLQVLMNLLTNAIKYNRPGGEVRLAAHGEGPTVTLSVSDTGRGLTPYQLKHLFEPFNRLGAEREDIEGTGIGLTIVKALVGGMGGRIAVSSHPGVGSRFDVTLPAADPDLPFDDAPPPPISAPAPIDAPRGQLLYIEDNPVNVMLVEELVRSLSGLRIHCETNGIEGVERAAALRPDLILVDMQLPDIDGYEVLRRLRARPETESIPCIALSANAMPRDIEHARAAGFDDYLTKPIDFRQFLDALETRFPA